MLELLRLPQLTTGNYKFFITEIRNKSKKVLLKREPLFDKNTVFQGIFFIEVNSNILRHVES